MGGNTVDVVVVGGGISGLACAKTLAERGCRDFKLITKDIGGRICTSADGAVNYGAYYVRRDYRNMRQYVVLKKRLRASDAFVFVNNELRHVTRSLIRHPFALARLLFLVKRFDRCYQRFKRRSEFMSQREAIEADPRLGRFLHADATEFLRRHRLGSLTDCLINPIVWSTALMDVREVPASTMLFLLLILIHPTYEFEFQADRITTAFADKIERDEVVSVARNDEYWKLETRMNNTCLARKLVMAAPIQTTIELLRYVLPQADLEINRPVYAHMVHVRGILRSPFNRARFVVLAPHNEDIVLARQEDGTHLLYSRREDINLADYFTQYDVIGRKFWSPAFWVGKRIIESRIRDDLYLIGDHSLVNMEDAFLTGVYAGNQLVAG